MKSRDERLNALYANLLNNAVKQYKQGRTSADVKHLMKDSGLNTKQIDIVANASFNVYKVEVRQKIIRYLLLGGCFLLVGIITFMLTHFSSAIYTCAAAACLLLTTLLLYKGLKLRSKFTQLHTKSTKINQK